jgi:hypothetical protein
MRRWSLLLLALAACKQSAPPPREGPAPIPNPSALAAPTTTSTLSGAGKIENYRVSFGRVLTPDKKKLVELRSFQRGGGSFVLAVSPQDLKTEVLRSDGLKIEPASLADLAQSFSGTPYFKALADAKQHDSALQNAGITHVLPEEHGVVLTVDLCPSRRPLDEILFNRVLTTFTPEEHPVPVAIAITGIWMEEHPKELERLLRLSREHKLEITWIDHSYHHRFDPKLPLPQNFLLEKGTQLDDEVLMTEARMIQTGITPSTLFRFPGLISDHEIVDKVLAFGLIPVGSDAWLAKKERAKSGDIVLVHGNGNEPQGVSDLLALLTQEKKDIRRRQFLLLDLRDALEQEEAK